MTHDEDDFPYSAADAERDRIDAIRTFRVLLLDGTHEVIFAHFWENAGPAGHWNFYTIDIYGQNRIRDSFGAHIVRKVEEKTDVYSPPLVVRTRKKPEPRVITKMPAGKM
jgi:hypothetical protein